METIKVEMNVVISAEDWSYAPGNIVELDKPLADAWIECGHAKPIKGEKVDKTVLPDGVEYKGHGVFIVKGNQPAATKTDAIEALKVRVAAEKAAAKAKEATEDAENSNVSNDGADNANGSEESS